MFICLDTIPSLDRQTDGQNRYNSIALCMHFTLTRDDNKDKGPESAINISTANDAKMHYKARQVHLSRKRFK